MKSYVKPSLEVISMKTSENIADNWIKTIYTRGAGDSSFTNAATDYATAKTYTSDYNAAVDAPSAS